MERLRKKIEDIIYDDGKTPFFSVKFILYLLSKIFGLIVSTRRTFYNKDIFKSFSSPVKVISVGNITVGGTGKTPFTIYLAKLLKENGFNPAVISRGYGGTLEEKGAVVHDGEKMLADVYEAGDEPYLIAEKLKNVPVYVGSSRCKSADKAVIGGADFLILDDGFQHLKIDRNFEIILLDSDKPFGNGHLIPRGSLRDPLKYLSLGDAFILTRYKGVDPDSLKNIIPSKNIFRTTHKESIYNVDGNCDLNILNGKSAFAFSGIAHNDKFRQSTTSLGLIVEGFKEYKDHHRYERADIDDIYESSKGCDFIVTTEKDFVKIQKINNFKNLLIVSIDIEFIDEGFDNFFLDKIKE
ncbi:MAG: tetraacyldisaccharide 4'-kinase [Desulfobacterales bacterium]|nr:tetraacyldisaccharide 4'-kinase [Desulfobacterales bacterium]MCP4160707.1 tetraacyldisaccharide 4'-kinase [Deltaproteobacteria bacterium]